MAKILPVVRLATQKLIVAVDVVVEVELLATTLTRKHIASVLPNFVLPRQLQRPESFFSLTLQGCTLSLSCAVSPPHTAVH